MISNSWAQVAVIVLANVALIVYMLRKAARDVGRNDWMRALWSIRGEFVPRWLKR